MAAAHRCISLLGRHQPPQQPPQPQCPTTPLVNGGSLRSASGTLLAVGTVLRMGHERGRVERFDEAGGW